MAATPGRRAPSPAGPAADAPSPDAPVAPALPVAAVARRLGVAPATLRTWDRRYGLGPTAHTAGAHRRYAPEDVARLELVRRLTLQGVSPAEAARAALAAPPDALPGVPPPGDLPEGGGEGDRAGGERPEGVPGDDVEAGRVVPLHPGRGGGGRVVALPDASPAARGLARAAMALDAQACQEVLLTHLRLHGVTRTWEDLAAPVLVAIGERWASTGEGVDAEHLLSECAMSALRATSPVVTAPRNARPVLLACAEEETHALPLHVLAAVLAEHAVVTRLLGARVPHDALVAAVRRSGPAAVVVWSQLSETGDPDQLVDLPHLRPAPVLLAGGRGWDADSLPPHVARPVDVTDAVGRILAAVGA